MKKIEKSNSQIAKKQKQNYLINKLKSKKLISTLSAVVLVPLPLFSISVNIEGKEDINSWGNIKLDTLDNGSHNSTLYSKNAKAKSSGMKSIENVAMHSPLLNDVKFSESKSPNDYSHIIAMNDNNTNDYSSEYSWDHKLYMYNIYSANNKRVTKSKTIYENITPKSWAQKFKILFREVTPSKVLYKLPYTMESLKNILMHNSFSTIDNLVATLDSSTKNNQVIKYYLLRDAANQKYAIELVWVKNGEKWNIQYNYTIVEGNTDGENDAVLTIDINEQSADEYLKEFKAAAIAELAGLEYPNKDDKSHDATLFLAIDQAKKAAIKAIQAVTDYKEVDGVKSTQIDLIKKAIDEYKKSTGTNKSLADNIAAAIAAINAIDLPIQNNDAHDAKLFPAIDQAKTAAINAIKAVTDYKEVDGVKSTQINLINAAIDAYKKSTGTDKEKIDAVKIYDLDLPKDKNKLPSEITNIPKGGTTKSGVEYKFSNWRAIDLLGKLVVDVSMKIGVATRNSYVTMYNFKVKSLDGVTQIIGINDNNKDKRKKEADSTNMYRYYKMGSKGTALSKTIYENITPKSWTQKFKINFREVTNSFAKYDKAYNIQSLKEIMAKNDFSTNDNLVATLDSSTKNNQVIKRYELKDATNKAYIIELIWVKKGNKWNIQTKFIAVDGDTVGDNDAILAITIDPVSEAELLNELKNAVPSELEGLKYPTRDDKARSATSFHAIKTAKDNALKLINAVKEIGQFAKIKSTQIDLIKKAIDAYNNSTGTDKMLADNITASIAAINAIDLPNKDDKSHDAKLFPAIDQAKKAAIKAIKAVTDYKEINGVKSTQIGLIKKAIDEYNNSIGTDKILSENNQNFFQKLKTSLLIVIGASLVIILGVSSIIIRKKNKKVKK